VKWQGIPAAAVSDMIPIMNPTVVNASNDHFNSPSLSTNASRPNPNSSNPAAV
jgi:hypothetical protein